MVIKLSDKKVEGKTDFTQCYRKGPCCCPLPYTTSSFGLKDSPGSTGMTSCPEHQLQRHGTDSRAKELKWKGHEQTYPWALVSYPCPKHAQK